MKYKKLIIAIVVMCVYYTTATFISYKYDSNNNEESQEEKISYEVSSYITDEMRANSDELVNYLCLMDELSPSKIGKDADCIALAKVISIEDVDSEGYLFGMTFGDMLINTVISGNLKEGQVISYAKPGGLMSYTEFEKGQPDAANQKREYLRQKSGTEIDLDNTYINVIAEGDIEIEAGKTYLVYLKYMNSTKSYEVIGLGNGLREVSVPQNLKSVQVEKLNTNNLTIKNNENGEYESLKNYINEYIGK